MDEVYGLEWFEGFILAAIHADRRAFASGGARASELGQPAWRRRKRPPILRNPAAHPEAHP